VAETAGVEATLLGGALMQSSIPHFKAALQTRLAAALTDALVAHGNPPQFPPKTVVIGDVTPEPITYTSGRNQATEAYSLDLLCSYVGNAGDLYSTFETGAFALANDASDSVLDWAQPQVTGTWGSVVLVEPRSYKPQEAFDPASGANQGCQVTLTIGVIARLL
jgi:hypothetical protein